MCVVLDAPSSVDICKLRFVNIPKSKTSENMLFPQDKTWKIVDGLVINSFSQSKIDATAAELIEERDTAVAFLGV